MTTISDYEIGQQLMVPMRGMCTIVEVTKESILDQELVFVHLKQKRGKGVLKMPVKQLEEQGVRPLVSKEEMLAALNDESEVEDLSEEESVDRLERWTSMMRSGDYGVRLQVLREITLVDHKDKLDDHEKRFQKNVRLAARREVESVLGTSAAGAGRKLNTALAKRA
jgi:RNA polymerase-interacting CarD/CdnL/TRCF family regulator